MKIEGNHEVIKKGDEINMAVMAKPNKRAFVVSNKAAKNFKNQKTSKEGWSEIMKMAKEFDRNNLKRK